MYFEEFYSMASENSQQAADWNSPYTDNDFRFFCDEDNRKKIAAAFSEFESGIAALWKSPYSDNDFRLFHDEDTPKKFAAFSEIKSRPAAHWNSWNSPYSDNDFLLFCDKGTRKKFTAFSSIASAKSRAATHWNSWNSPYSNDVSDIYWGEDTPKNLTEFYSMASAESQQAYINDVFLSFRGEDTRKNFTDHLYKALTDSEIRTFKDDHGIKKGEDIKSELKKAIRESMMSVVVISKNYASSGWCLDELDMIMLLNKTLGHGVLPVFYGVDPSDVRNQTGCIGEAFVMHEKELELATGKEKKELQEKIRRWRVALTKVANLAGMNLKDQDDGHEARFIENIIKVVRDKLRRIVLDGASHLSRVENFKLRFEDLPTDFWTHVFHRFVRQENYVSRGSQPYGYWDWVFESYPHLSKLVDMNIAIQRMQEQDLLFPNSYPYLPRWAVEVVDRALPEKAKGINIATEGIPEQDVFWNIADPCLRLGSIFESFSFVNIGREKQDKSPGAGNDGGESKSSGKKSKRKGVKMGTTPPKSKKGEGSEEKEENVRKREQQLHDVSLVGITIPKMCFGFVLRCAREMLPLQMVF